MQQSVTSHELKKINRAQVYQYIYRHRSASRSEVASALGMSFPTVTQNLSSLEAQHLIERSGFMDSTGGRKAQIYTCNSTVAVSAGLEILKEFVRISVIDIYGTVLSGRILNLPYSNEDCYFQEVCSFVNRFLEELPYPNESILGVGIAIQALISTDGTRIVYGQIMGNTGLTLEHFGRYLHYPCIFLHDASAAASATLWFDEKIKDAVYLSLNRNFGGALILNRHIYHGHSMISGTYEHLCLVPDGRLCYCGKRGCMETYCSANSLRDDAGMELPVFFDHVRNNDFSAVSLWDKYLRTLARGIGMIRHVIDCDIIIGGFLNTFFTAGDYLLLSEYTDAQCSLNAHPVRIIPGPHSDEIPSIGAGLFFIRPFLGAV